jgi:hypothetical protein
MSAQHRNRVRGAIYGWTQVTGTLPSRSGPGKGEIIHSFQASVLELLGQMNIERPALSKKSCRPIFTLMIMDSPCSSGPAACKGIP